MEDTTSAISAHGPPVILIVIGLLALILAFKVGKFVLKLVLGVLALILILGAVWWFVQGH
jgi:membrane-bound ClpP family serine protease